MRPGSVGQACLGIEEVVCAVNVEVSHRFRIPIIIVAHALYGIAYVAVLHIDVCRQAAGDVYIGTGVDIRIELASCIMVILLQGIYRAYIIAHPGYVAEVVTAMPVGRAAQYCVHAAVAVVEVENTAPEVVVVVFQTHEVALGHQLAL